MAILSDADIGRMRATVDSSLGGTAIIQSKSIADDGGGGGTLSWTAAGTVSCRLMANTPSRDPEGRVADRLTPQADWIVTVPATTSVNTEQRIITQGHTLEVTHVSDRTFEMSKGVFTAEVT